MIKVFGVCISINREILELLDAWAQEQNTSRSDVVRRLVLAEAERRGEGGQEAGKHEPI